MRGCAMSSAARPLALIRLKPPAFTAAGSCCAAVLAGPPRHRKQTINEYGRAARRTLHRFFKPLQYSGFMVEKRISQRHRVLKAGTIEFGGGAIDCMVRNISAAGAALDVTSPVGIPEHVTLITDGSHLPCRVTWRKEKRIGIAFD
jgi:hypothetical protein